MPATPSAPKSFQAYPIRIPAPHPRPQGQRPAHRCRRAPNEGLQRTAVQQPGRLSARLFPRAARNFERRKWAKPVARIFAEHRCHTPFFRQIPDEFVQYVQSERGVRAGDPPFMPELAHYEWIELVLSVSNKAAELDRSPRWRFDQRSPGLESRLSLAAIRLSRTARLGPSTNRAPRPHNPPISLVFRDADFTVRFIELNPVSRTSWSIYCKAASSVRETASRKDRARTQASGSACRYTRWLGNPA